MQRPLIAGVPPQTAQVPWFLALNNKKVADAQIELKATYDMRFVQNAPKK
jgi:hypothetical protein